MKTYITAVLLVLTLTSCMEVFDPAGDGDLRYAEVSNSTYVVKSQETFVDSCLVDTSVNRNSQYYSVTITQFAFGACERDFSYLVLPLESSDYSREAPLYKATLNGYDLYSWIVYDNFSSYVIEATVDEETYVVARIERVE